MGKYSNSPEWADVAPLVQEESAVAPLAQIAYSEDYSEAMSYLRAVMATDEKSERVLELTETIIRMNPAHYTVWLYRSATLAALNSNLEHELTHFLNPLSLAHLKNYQIWHHRQTIIDRLDSYTHEHAFLQSMFARDAKNYHVWSYRQWLVRRFALWDDPREWQAVADLLSEDVRNNSAWNHRWYLAFARPIDEQQLLQQLPPLSRPDVVQKELAFAMEQVAVAPQNASPWNYIRGLLDKATGAATVSREEIVAFASKYAGTGQHSEVAQQQQKNDHDVISSSHALELLALVYAAHETPEKRADAVSLLELLADKYDPIRAPYWRYRIALVNGSRPAVAAAA